METRNIAESNDYRMFYKNQSGIDVGRIRFSESLQETIPSSVRSDFLARVCEAYNQEPTQDDALHIITSAKDTIKAMAGMLREARKSGTDATELVVKMLNEWNI